MIKDRKQPQTQIQKPKNYVDYCSSVEALLQDSGLVPAPYDEWNTFIPKENDYALVNNIEYIFANGEWVNVETKEICVYDSDKVLNELSNELRAKRKPLLEAFDIYKSNVNYGIIVESESEHNNIKNWYNSILNLDKNAINNPPKAISKYIQILSL